MRAPIAAAVLSLWLLVMISLASSFSPRRASGDLLRMMLTSSSALILTPPTFDYQAQSRRATLLFVDKEGTNATATTKEEVIMVGKSRYSSFLASGLVDSATIILAEAVGGSSLSKFPGTKLVRFPRVQPPESGSAAPAKEEIEQKHVAFYDDEAPLPKLNVETILSTLKNNKTYEFKEYLNTTTPTFGAISAGLADKLCQGHALKSIKFDFFKGPQKGPPTPTPARIVWPANADRHSVLAMARATTLMRDLTDSPALTLGPAQLAGAAMDIAAEFGSTSLVCHAGVEALLEANYPQVAAVGMASAEGREPRVVDFTWGTDLSHPLVVVVGKGVCFDTGGLNIKGGGGMRSMKKDMAGAAQALSLCLLIAEHKLPIRLRCLLPIVENSISGIALRPGDVIRARNNMTTEITNTDAEGRLILADCLVAACEENPLLPTDTPAMVVDFATLTGAARVALGNDLPALFSNNHTQLMRLFDLSRSDEVSDPMWPLPLWQSYKGGLRSGVADMVNAGEGAGAITAALYLEAFIGAGSSSSGGAAGGPGEKSADAEADGADAAAGGEGTGADKDNDKDKKKATPLWFHIDFMGSKGGHADPQGMRAVFEYIKRQMWRE